MRPSLRATVFDSASVALRFNAPLGDDRAMAIAAWLGQAISPGVVVDLGCGTGALLEQVVASTAHRGVGVDRLESATAPAVERARAAGLEDRLAFVTADVSGWWPDHSPDAPAVVMVGADHAFGSLADAFAAVAPHAGAAVIGTGCWVAEPDDWCLEAFGELPHGVDGVVALAERAGFAVDRSELSTLDEWDQFEGTWCDGALGAGVGEADVAGVAAFVAERRDDYDRYRGVLGFAWLYLLPGE